MSALPRVIKNCLPTLNNVRVELRGNGSVDVSYPLTRPGDPERVELHFAKPTGVWMLYSCTENLPEGQWERIQQYLTENQTAEA